MRPLRAVLRHLREDRGELIEGLLVRSGVIGLFLHDHVEDAVFNRLELFFGYLHDLRLLLVIGDLEHHVGVEEVLDVRGHKLGFHFAGAPQIVEYVHLGEVVWHLLRLDTRPTAHLTLGGKVIFTGEAL